MKQLIIILVLFCILLHSCRAQLSKNVPHRQTTSKEREDSLGKKVPAPVGFVSDYANVLTEKERSVLDSLIMDYESRTTVEIAVATVTANMVSEDDLEDYSLVMLRYWGVGKKEKNNGILIVVSPRYRRIRIQNGYGIEVILSDAETKEIIENIFIPRLREGKYFEGIRDGINAITEKLKE